MNIVGEGCQWLKSFGFVFFSFLFQNSLTHFMKQYFSLNKPQLKLIILVFSSSNLIIDILNLLFPMSLSLFHVIYGVSHYTAWEIRISAITEWLFGGWGKIPRSGPIPWRSQFLNEVFTQVQTVRDCQVLDWFRTDWHKSKFSWCYLQFSSRTVN